MPFGSIGNALAVSAGTNLLGGLIGANAAENAANTQAQAQRDSMAVQKAMFDKQNQQQTGYRAAGGQALSQIGALGSGTYGIYDAEGNQTGTGTGSGYLTHQFDANDFANGIDPGYAFRLKQGQEQAQRQANQAGGAVGGNTLTALQDYTQGQASQEFGNTFNRYQTQRGNIYNTLASIAGLGQTSLGQTGTAATTAGANIGQAISNAGSASAAGQVGAANAYGGALSGIGNNYMLSSLLKPQTNGANYSLNNGNSNASVANLSDMGGGQGIQFRT